MLWAAAAKFCSILRMKLKGKGDMPMIHIYADGGFIPEGIYETVKLRRESN
jgi:hypothetical protein